MTEIEMVTTVLDLIQSFGFWIVFFWLYYSEKKSHEDTRKQYRNDLREVAGFNANISLQRTTKTPSTSENSLP